MTDLTYAWRTLRTAPGFALVAILTIALGVGANAAIFTVVNGVLLRPLPYADPDRLFVVSTTMPGVDFLNTAFSPVQMRAWQDNVRGAAAIGGYANTGLTLTTGGDPIRIRAVRMSAAALPMLGVAPALGRLFDETHEAPGAPRVVVLSHGLWITRFGGSPSIVGSAVRLDDEACTVVGVMPPGFDFPARTEAWVPLVLTAAENDPRLAFLQLLARPAPGVSMDAARDQLQAQLISTSARARERRVGLVTVLEHRTFRSRDTLLAVMLAVGLVLVIACANVANLLLARASGRGAEMAVRSALGASTWRLVRQLLTESLLLTGIGGWLGLLIALWVTRVFAVSGPQILPRMDTPDTLGLDWRVLFYTFAVVLITGVAVGLLPALSAGRSDLVESMKGTRRGLSRAAGGLRLQRAFVAVEVALTVVLLAAGGLLLGSFARLVRVDPGLDPKGVLTFNLSLPPARYPTPAHRTRFADEVLRALRETAGSRPVAAALAPPFSGYTYSTSFARVDGDAKGSSEYRVVSDAYFRTLAIPVVEGREFAASDTDAALPVAIVSRSMAAQHWPNASPIGSRITVGMDSQSTAPPRERVIVGVVEDVRHDSLGAPLAPTLYLPIAQHPPAFFTVMMRDPADALALVPAAKRAVALVDPLQPIEDLSSLEERIDRTVAQPRFYASLLGAFAAIALVLASVGVYGVVSYFAAQREYDLGLHVALGARPRDVIALVARAGLVPVAIGAAAGLLLSRTATRAIAHLLFAVEPTDPLVLGSAAVLLLAVAGLACLLPARRAARVDPMVTLRAS